MNRTLWFKRRLLASLAVVFLATAACSAGDAGSTAAGTNGLQQASVPKKKSAKKPQARPAKPPPKQLSGAELYAVHCNRCHPERYAAERSDAQWETILLHMRVRANVPGKEAKAILKYLQEDSGK